MATPTASFVKQPASAAHTYGHRLVLAEGFTDIGPHWQESLSENLKPSFDHAACEGLNLLVWHAFVCSPEEMGMPGQQYFAGTHFNPNTTWWSKSAPFLAYINRCQFLLQQGLFVADAASYYGDHVPNFAQLKRSDPARVLPGYDYDVVTEEVHPDAHVRARRAHRAARRHELPRAGVARPPGHLAARAAQAEATRQGWCDGHRAEADPRPTASPTTLRAMQKSRGWPMKCGGGPPLLRPWTRPFGKGRVISGKTAREVLLADGVKPDFEFRLGAKSDIPSARTPNLGTPSSTGLDYIHRAVGDADIYFVANRSNRWEEADCTFRVAGKAPELWDPVSGVMRPAVGWSQTGGRTTLALQLASYGSMFVVFRKSLAPAANLASGRNFPAFSAAQEITGPWTVQFDPKWGGPESAEFDNLMSWTQRPEPGIKYFSGTAIYHKTFDLPEALRRPGQRLTLDLGDVKNLAEVRLNGKNLGILWAVPFRVDVTDAIKPTGNSLEIEVVNFWPNRIIGDQLLAPEKRLTRTNIRKLTKETPLMDSGLLGPVSLLAEER